MTNNDQQKPVAVIFIPQHNFLLPYFERQLGNLRIITDISQSPQQPVKLAVMVSSTDVYDVSSGHFIDENTPLKSTSKWVDMENEFVEYCHHNGLNPTIVRCPEVIGTGMRGLAMRMARGIARGTLMHIRGNKGVMSLIHAVDVAKYAVDGRITGMTVNLTDGAETTTDALIDALAHRLNDKTIFTIKWPVIAKALYGSAYYNQLANQLTFNNKAISDAIGSDFAPNIVTQYLTTHIYDDTSL